MKERSTSKDTAIVDLQKASEAMETALSSTISDNETSLSDIPYVYGPDSVIDQHTPNDPSISDYIRDITGMSQGKYEGLNYFGPKLDMKEEDPDYKKPTKANKAHVKQFDLTNEEDLSRYTAVCQSIADDQSILGFEEREYDPTLKSWRVLMRWYDQFYVAPEGENYGHQ